MKRLPSPAPVAAAGLAQVLGTPLGTDVFIRDHADAKVAKAGRVEAAIVSALLPEHDLHMLVHYFSPPRC